MVYDVHVSVNEGGVAYVYTVFVLVKEVWPPCSLWPRRCGLSVTPGEEVMVYVHVSVNEGGVASMFILVKEVWLLC